MNDKILIDRAVVEQALEALECNRRSHYYCEDTWYSCPKHEEGCANESDGEECNCGADEANTQIDSAIITLRATLEQPEQEPVAMRMPKVGDKVVCIEDESLGTVVYLTAGGSPEIKFDDGSHGTYMLREFAELFGYTHPPLREWQSLTDEEIAEIAVESHRVSPYEFYLGRLIEAKLKKKNT